jgi:transposase-like protein
MKFVKFKKRRGQLIHIRLSEKLHQRVKIRTAYLKTTMQRWVVSTLRNALRKKKRKPKKQEGLIHELFSNF